MLKKIFKAMLVVTGVLVMAVVGFLIYVRIDGTTTPPVPPSLSALSLTVAQPDSGLFTIGGNWFRRSESGLYELRVEGKAFDRGVINGKLTQELVRYQEEVFNDQINKLVPSAIYRGMLRYFIGFFNRDLDEHVSEEYRLEIYGVSHAASGEYDDIASPYQRILNYHAAHDIGHALQNMSLVGCTAFATWGDRSEDGSLIIGRNFDFYVGDEFARDKIVAFYEPDEGHRFMMVTFGGMTGVVSGMNEEGLTVTINAAKAAIPSSAATPVSLVAREILQYAATIDEAWAIAARRRMFVAESFLIGSARDHKAVIIEKSPDGMGRYETNENFIIGTNHFQSPELAATPENVEHIRTSASQYRHDRVRELLERAGRNTVANTAAMLRDQKGIGDTAIGMGNEKAINQLVAHHGIVFQPEKRLVWVSTAPWQLGKFVCYDLTKVFGTVLSENREIAEESLSIPADPFVGTADYRQYVKFSRYRFPFAPREGMNPDSVVRWNPGSYHAWMLAGDALRDDGDYPGARKMYLEGLKREIATVQEKEHLESGLRECNEHLK